MTFEEMLYNDVQKSVAVKLAAKASGNPTAKASGNPTGGAPAGQKVQTGPKATNYSAKPLNTTIPETNVQSIGGIAMTPVNTNGSGVVNPPVPGVNTGMSSPWANR